MDPAYTERDTPEMPTVHQVRIPWLGIEGAPGVSTFYFDASSAVPMTDLKAFFTSIMTLVPNAASVTFPGSGMDIDTSSGQPVGTWSTDVLTGVSGSGGAAYSGPVGGVINWHTGAFAGGREVRGKTFIVPLSTAQFGNDGLILSAASNTLGSAATTLAGGPASFVIWSRKGQLTAAVTSATSPRKPAVLRSRRD